MKQPRILCCADNFILCSIAPANKSKRTLNQQTSQTTNSGVESCKVVTTAVGAADKAGLLVATPVDFAELSPSLLPCQVKK
jgi:hypothetical protein